MTIEPSDSTKGLMAAMAVVLFWAGFNIVSRFGATSSFTPYDIAAIRFAVSGAIALPFFLRFVPRKDWPRHAAIAVFGGAGYCLLVYTGFAHAPTAHAGVFVNGGVAFWTIVIMAVLGGFRIPRHTVLALGLTTAGLWLMGKESLLASGGASHWMGDLLFFGAALTWAIFGLLLRRWQISPFMGVLGVSTFSAFFYLPVYALGLPAQLAHASWQAITLQVVYQGVVVAFLAAGLYVYAVQKIGAGETSMMLALVPAVTAIGGLLLLGALPPGALARVRSNRA